MMLPAQWPRYRPLIEEALMTGPGVENIEDVERQLKAGTYFLVPGERSAAVIGIDHYAQKKCLTVQHAGGDLNELLDGIGPRIERFAKANGCNLAMILGRDGWKRTMEQRGFRLGWIAMVKDL